MSTSLLRPTVGSAARADLGSDTAMARTMDTAGPVMWCFLPKLDCGALRDVSIIEAPLGVFLLTWLQRRRPSFAHAPG